MMDGAFLRRSGGVFAMVFALVAWATRGSEGWPWIFGALAVVVFGVAILRPALLDRPTRAWLRLGEMMHRVVNPVVLGVLFVLLIVPTGLLRRLLAGDPLHRKPNPSLATYWVECERREYNLNRFRTPY